MKLLRQDTIFCFSGAKRGKREYLAIKICGGYKIKLYKVIKMKFMEKKVKMSAMMLIFN